MMKTRNDVEQRMAVVRLALALRKQQAQVEWDRAHPVEASERESEIWFEHFDDRADPKEFVEEAA